RVHPLPTEVVNHEGPAVSLHLERGLVEADRRAMDEVHGLDCQLAADDDERPLDPDPPSIVRPGAAADRLRVGGIKHFYGLPRDLKRVGYPVAPALDGVQRFGDRRLAAARRAHDEKAPPRAGHEPERLEGA